MHSPAYHTIETLRTRFLMEPMPMMRGEILKTLAVQGDDGLAPFLLALLDGASPAFAADCLEGLAHTDSFDAIDAARPYLSHPHPNLRRLAIIVLWRFPAERHEAMPTVLDLFPSMREDDYVHLPYPARASYLVGIRTVGDIRLETAVPGLERGLDWHDPDVRLECACSLLRLGERSGADELRSRFASGDEEARRRAEALTIDKHAFFG